MTTRNDGPSPRRQFLKTAGVLAVGTAAVGSAACDVKEPSQVDESSATRTLGFDRTLLDALATTVLPGSLGAAGVRAATDRFVAWADGYAPVADEMHGYGYSDIRYLPADPAPDAGRFLSMRFRVRPESGAVFGAKLRERTGDDAVDACALDLLKALVIERKPMYPDHIEMTVTWALPGGEAP
jgi:hypothetical protein